jgi:hypothetical protein
MCSSSKPSSLLVKSLYWYEKVLYHICGLYYKTITIVIDTPSVVKSDATIWSVTFDDTRSVNYDRNMAKLASSITFMVLASFTSVTYDRQMTIVIVL